jgi:hydroxymethylpyrimidine/phosphomethylpyrimidine kinase
LVFWLRSILGTRHGDEREIHNRLYCRDGTQHSFTCHRLGGSFHGSGCTLASALAARLAAGESLVAACEQAQSFTWQALAHGWQPGKDQRLPRRLWELPALPACLAPGAPSGR